MQAAEAAGSRSVGRMDRHPRPAQELIRAAGAADDLSGRRGSPAGWRRCQNGAMRVVAGTARGRRLAAPPGAVTRPTPDRVREAVFNSLYSLGVLPGCRVLDLYAGTGAMGIEALSRGASFAVFVESAPEALAALRANLASTGLEDRAEVMAADVDDYLRAADAPHDFGPGAADPSHDLGPAAPDQPHGYEFDLAVVDPPYGFDGWADLLPRLSASVVVIESNREVEGVGPLVVRRRRRYGSTVVTLASKIRPDPDPLGGDP